MYVQANVWNMSTLHTSSSDAHIDTYRPSE